MINYKLWQTHSGRPQGWSSQSTVWRIYYWLNFKLLFVCFWLLNWIKTAKYSWAKAELPIYFKASPLKHENHTFKKKKSTKKKKYCLSLSKCLWIHEVLTNLAFPTMLLNYSNIYFNLHKGSAFSYEKNHVYLVYKSVSCL